MIGVITVINHNFHNLVNPVNQLSISSIQWTETFPWRWLTILVMIIIKWIEYKGLRHSKWYLGRSNTRYTCNASTMPLKRPKSSFSKSSLHLLWSTRGINIFSLYAWFGNQRLSRTFNLCNKFDSNPIRPSELLLGRAGGCTRYVYKCVFAFECVCWPNALTTPTAAKIPRSTCKN